MNTIIIIAVVYALSGVAAYGLTFWFFQDTFPTLAVAQREKDARFANGFAILGPLGLLVALIGIPHGRYSMSIKPVFRYRMRFSAK